MTFESARRPRGSLGMSGKAPRHRDEGAQAGTITVRGEMSLEPDSPITLREASEICLRGVVKEATLRKAVSAGELTFEFLGRRIVTTPAHVAEWRERCRVKAGDRISTSKPAPTPRPSGISATVDTAKAQDAAKTILRALGSNSGTISRARQGRNSARVIPLKSESRT